jgi:hypothetical protein
VPYASQGRLDTESPARRRSSAYTASRHPFSSCYASSRVPAHARTRPVVTLLFECLPRPVRYEYAVADPRARRSARRTAAESRGRTRNSPIPSPPPASTELAPIGTSTACTHRRSDGDRRREQPSNPNVPTRRPS